MVTMRFVAGMAVDQISSAELSDLRQITSSRQSPKMSPASAGVDFVPLFDESPGAVDDEEFGSRS